MKKFLLESFVLSVLICLSGCGDKTNRSQVSDPGSGMDTNASSTTSGTAVDSVVVVPEIIIPETDFPERVFWGDENLHTGQARGSGHSTISLDPETALQFARGSEVTGAAGQKARLNRPLDWLAITDFSDRTGEISAVYSREEKARAALLDFGEGKAVDFTASVWDSSIDIVEKYNEPGTFTAFIAYDWASDAGGGDILHRNVIYRDGPEIARQVVPITTTDSEDPEDLWKWMAGFEEKTGGSVLAIPHNANLSNGLMFNPGAFNGRPLTAEMVALRNKYEVLYEITQSRGTSESHMALFPSDEFAYFELWDRGNLLMVPKKDGMMRYEYARQALIDGLSLEKQFGVNPFKYGFVGGSGSFNGLSIADEDSFSEIYKPPVAGDDPWEDKVLDYDSGAVNSWELGASGYTGIWATANTRAAVWDAMKRRETYATTGPRFTVRFFGGFNFAAADMAGDMAETGYKKGVPMGGDLQGAPGGKAPSFMIAASKDPYGGNLDRVQVIKGWLDAQGKARSKIYNAVWGDAEIREPMAAGILPSVGNTADLEAPGWDDSIGDPELQTLWTDPDFDPALKSFYYLRVLAIPTPRWTAYKSVRDSLEITGEIPMTLQERAFTSPIWYSPD